MIQARTIPLRWKESGLGYEPRLEAILQSWAGTPYMEGQQRKGAGVNCVRFLTAVWDELMHRDPLAYDRLPRDVSLNQPEIARSFMHTLLRNYQPIEDVTGTTIFAEPGDALVVAAPHAGPGHAIIVGARRNTTWQAGTHGVMQTGWGLVDKFQTLTHHFRFGNRDSWTS